MPITGQPRDKVVTLDYRFATGLEKVKDPTRVITQTEEGGISPVYGLLEADNVDLDATGWLSLRPGQILLKSGTPHSIKAWDDLCLYGQGTTLKRLHTDFSTTSDLFTGLCGGNISYTQIGYETYFSDGTVIGKIVNGVYSALLTVTYGVNKQITINHLNTTRKTTPPGQLLENYHNRLHVASGNILWITDPFAYHRVHKRDGFMQLSGYITLLKSVSDGFFVGDALGIYFIQGDYPKVYKRINKESYQAIIYAVSDYVGSSLIGGELPAGKYFFFLSTHGVCLAGDGGYFKNLTEKKYPTISAKQGCGLFRTTIKQVFGQQRSIDQVIFSLED